MHSINETINNIFSLILSQQQDSTPSWFHGRFISCYVEVIVVDHFSIYKHIQISKLRNVSL